DSLRARCFEHKKGEATISSYQSISHLLSHRDPCYNSFMSRLRFTIVKEKRPGRCDVCHKSDQFDPQTGICNRCRNLPVEELTNPKFDSIQSIPPSSLASTIATIVACFCLSASLSILNGFFGPAASLLGGRHVFFYGMLLLSVITLIV